MAHPATAGSGGGRDDCWSEGGTACLVDSWGDRYIRLNRGNLRQKDWSDVAAAVNARQDLLGRPRRTDVQCKNRIDTVKKKYKLEKSKPPGTSQWPLFAKFDSIVGTSAVRNPRNLNGSLNLGGSSSRLRFQPQSLSSETESSLGGGDDDDEDDDDVDVEAGRVNERLLIGGGFGREKRKWEGLVECERGGERGGGELGQLARAIVSFAEVYERVENAKQQQVMELERQRMEFAKEVEFQRMKLFMEAQIEIEKMKMKWPKYGSGSGEKRSETFWID